MPVNAPSVRAPDNRGEIRRHALNLLLEAQITAERAETLCRRLEEVLNEPVRTALRGRRLLRHADREVDVVVPRRERPPFAEVE